MSALFYPHGLCRLAPDTCRSGPWPRRFVLFCPPLSLCGRGAGGEGAFSVRHCTVCADGSCCAPSGASLFFAPGAPAGTKKSKQKKHAPASGPACGRVRYSLRSPFGPAYGCYYASRRVTPSLLQGPDRMRPTDEGPSLAHRSSRGIHAAQPLPQRFC